MRKFDTKIQQLKYRVLREVATGMWEDNLSNTVLDIPKMIVPGKQSTMRCCVYKERAILAERVKIAMGGDKNNPNIIEVIDIACDECPVAGYWVTEVCRGCLAHHCEEACRFGAITFDRHQKAHINKDKCVGCGACAKVCPYTAIANNKRPCENACKVKAITMNVDKSAAIDNDKCTYCGACIYQCPFGAISDKSFITDVISMLKHSKATNEYKVYAVVAPSIANQFTYGTLGQVLSGLKELGFDRVIEAALGADMVAYQEAVELSEKGVLTSSCCTAFVEYIKKQFPQLVDYISHNLSPMATIAKYIKEHEDNIKIVFIGPCTAKKMEINDERVKPYVDSVLTFEELQALFDSKYIDISILDEDDLNEASYYGRIFARSGGVSAAVTEAIKEQNIDFEVKAVPCEGLEACKIALLKLSKGVLDGNFIEGMACVGGCIGGAGCLSHGEKKKSDIDKYGQQSQQKDMTDAIEKLKNQ